MYRQWAIKSDVLPRYEFPKFSEGDVSQQTLPNKACTGRVGTVRLFKHFSRFKFFLPVERISVPPTRQ
jgi:hypothetical protein